MNAIKTSSNPAATEVNNTQLSVTNDEFLAAIFGTSFSGGYPLVCCKSGDPDESAWTPRRWPCDTDNSNLNWYFGPSLFRPDDSGRFRAKKDFAVAVCVVMVDDVGTKVLTERFSECPPSWAIETSPGNFQYGYILSEPTTNLEIAEKLKEHLIQAGLCDKGATGATARWARLPNAINGRPKYGTPSPRCRLTQWNLTLKYSIDELREALGLNQICAQTSRTASASNTMGNSTELTEGHDAIIKALMAKGLYKSPIGGGKHDITCPWVEQHTGGLDNGAAYFEPNEKYPTGGFKCHHSHGGRYHIRDLLDYLQPSNQTLDGQSPGQPQRLPSALLTVPELNPEHLPDAIKDAVVDIAERLQCPMDYLAVAMLSAAGAVIGNKVGIFPYANDESWQVFPALWGGIVGDPGSKKTPSLQAAHSPLRHLESAAAQKYAQDFQAYTQALDKHKQDIEAWTKSKSKGLKPTPPPEPKRTRYVVHDSTYQSLGVILADNPKGVLALSDELSGLLQSLDTPGQEAARGFYLSGWSGTGGYSFDRIGRGSITLDRFCLSVFGGFQPDRVKTYVKFSQRGSSKNDGLLQRFQLLVWPDPVLDPKLVDRLPNKAAITKFTQAIITLPSAMDEGISGAERIQNGSQLLHFSSGAQALFNQWFLANEALLRKKGLDSARQGHFAKYRSLIPALALLFHLLDGHAGAVCEDCLIRAVNYAKYLKGHADRIYASVSDHDYGSMRTLAEHLFAGDLGDGFTCRSLALKGWTGLTTSEQAQAAIDGLIEYGWLSGTEVRNGGRPTIRYQLIPAASADLL